MKTLQKTIIILITLALPLLIILTTIRLVMTPAFLEFEYRMPGFPADQFGFSLEDRLAWSKVSLNYLLNDADISFLEAQKLPNGEALFNQRELRHMEDVKKLAKIALNIWLVLILAFFFSALGFIKNKSSQDFWISLKRGGWLTIVLILLVLLGILISFDALFTEFHRIFFEGDTWLFLYNDSLIRLFPERFWQDVFLAIGGLSIGLAFFTIFVSQKLLTKSGK